MSKPRYAVSTAVLVVLIAAAALAVGASQALAATKLCNQNVAECGKEKASKTFPIGTRFEGSALNTHFRVESFPEAPFAINCASGKVESKTTALVGLPVEIIALKFGECTDAGLPCTVSSKTFGMIVTLTAGAAGNGTVNFGEEKVEVEIDCPTLLTCRYAASPTLSFVGGSPPRMVASELELQLVPMEKESACAAKAKWWDNFASTNLPFAFLTN